MPQLDVSTFASQIFWLVFGFFVFYIVCTKLILPPLEEVLCDRASHIQALLDAAQSANKEATEMEDIANAALEDAKFEIAAADDAMMAQLRQDDIDRRHFLHNQFSENVKKITMDVQKSADKAYQELYATLADFVVFATTKIVNNFFSKQDLRNK